MKKILLAIMVIYCVKILDAVTINIPADQLTIQAGIDVAVDGDTVLVQPGTYVENINYNGKNITVASLFFTTQDTSYISQTIIDGNNISNVVKFINGEDSTAVLSGFTLMNGYASGSNLYNDGGGVQCLNSSPRIEHLIIKNCYASDNGAGIYMQECSPQLNNILLFDNHGKDGGALCFEESNAVLNRIVAVYNTSEVIGGAIAIGTAEYSQPIINNSTFANNYCDLYGGGVYSSAYATPIFVNCIFWNNHPEEFYFSYGGSIDITYSDIEGGWTGIGNIDSDPAFVDSSNYNFHLTSNSPCIDAGNPNSPPDPDGTIADMGAYYFDQSRLTANFSADTTNGYVPLTVNFTDLSVPQDSIVTWQWDFQNDGIIDSYLQNPSYTYTNEDSFSVKLIVQSLTETDTLIKENYIKVTYGPPQNLTAIPSLTDITLNWNKCYYPNILIYKIYRDTNPNPTTQINAVIHPDTNYVDINVDMNTTYYYRVTGYTSLGDETDYSNEVFAQLLPQMSVNPHSFDFTVNAESDSTIVDSFLIDNTGGGQLNYSIVGTDTLGNVGSGSILSFNPSSGILDAGSRLSQDVIMAVDVEDLIDGIYNTSADITHNDPNVTNPFIIPVTITVDRTVPEQVTGLYSTVTSTDITLYWNPCTASDLDKYNIYRSIEPSEPALLDSANSNDTTYVDSDIPDEAATYYYWVTAVDENGNESVFSDSIVTYLDIPAAVQNLNIEIIGSDAVLNWSSVDTTVYGNPIQDLTGYIVYFTEKIYNADTLFSYLAFTPDTTYTHEYAGTFADNMFYKVTAYVGDLDLLLSVIKNHPDIKLGELDRLIEKQKYRISRNTRFKQRK